MTWRTTRRFERLLRRLPRPLRERAIEKLLLWEENPQHPSLRFKSVSEHEPIWSMRINRQFRMLGIREDDHVMWYWVGAHGEYDQLLKRL